LIPGIITTGIIFAFTCISAYFLHLIHLLTPFPQHIPPTGANPPFLGRTCFTLLFSNFIEEKKRNEKTKIMTL
jgi:hypothetical protein